MEYFITRLQPNQVFVFGSNLAGRHGKGAAKQAVKWGAIRGQASGLQGQTYGIPTKDGRYHLDPHLSKVLSVAEIKVFVDEFIRFAQDNPKLIFLVTEIGCGLSRYKPKDIAPLFAQSLLLENVILPPRFVFILKESLKK